MMPLRDLVELSPAHGEAIHAVLHGGDALERMGHMVDGPCDTLAEKVLEGPAEQRGCDYFRLNGVERHKQYWIGLLFNSHIESGNRLQNIRKMASKEYGTPAFPPMNGSGSMVHPQDLFVALVAFSVEATVKGKQQAIGKRGGIGVFTVSRVRYPGHGGGVGLTPAEVTCCEQCTVKGRPLHFERIGATDSYQSCDGGECKDFTFGGPHVQFVTLVQGQRRKAGRDGVMRQKR